MDARDRVNLRLKKLLEYVDFLRQYQGIAVAEIKADAQKRGAIERYLQLAAEVVVGVANILNAEYKFSPAKDGRESIEILGKEGVLDREFANEFAGIYGFRNILVHDYLKIDYKKLVDNLNNKLGDFEEFAKQVARYLQS